MFGTKSSLDTGSLTRKLLLDGRVVSLDCRLLGR